MAQDFEKIINLLHEMQRTNNANADNFDRLLMNLSEKFGSSSGGPSSELLGAYVNELTKSVDDKYSVTLSKFQDIEQALKAVYNIQNDALKSSEMKEFFDIFSKNINNFYTEARQEKAILSGIESKISDLMSNKSDKDDIIRTISLLKNDFENINHAYKNTIDNVNTTLKSILSNIINLDPTKSGDTAKAQIEIMYHSLNDIVEKLQFFEEKESALEKILNNVATNKDLKITKGLIDSIIVKTAEIEQVLKDVASKDDVDEIRRALEYLNKRADRIVTVDEFIEIRNKTDDLINQTDEVKQSLSKVAQDIENVPNGDELEESMRKLYFQVEDLGHSIEASSVRGDFDVVVEKLDTLKSEFEIIKNIVTDLNDAVNERIIATVETISFDEETQDLKISIENMLNELPQQSDIERILKNNSEIFKNLLEKTDEVSNKLDSIANIEKEIDTISKEQSNISQKISDINFEKEFSYIYDKTSSIESWLIDSNIKENSEKIASQIENTPSVDLEQVNLRTNQIIEYLEELTNSKDVDDAGNCLNNIDTNVVEIISLLKNSSLHDENMEISDKLSDLERSISEIVSRNEFNDFIEELKYCITQLSTNTGSCSQNISEMLDLRKEIDEKLNSFDFSQVLRVLNGKFDQLQTRLSDSITEEVIDNIKSGVVEAISTNDVFADIKDSLEKISDVEENIENVDKKIDSIDLFVHNNIPINEDLLQSKVEELKELINRRFERNASSGYDEDDIEIIKDYLDDIRSVISKDPNDELIYKISAVEDLLSVNHTSNETALSNIMDKLESLTGSIGAIPDSAQELSEAISELSSLSENISSLPFCENVKELAQDTKLSKIEEFLNQKFGDLKQSLSGLLSNDKNSNFVYQSALSEEKIDALMNFISSIKGMPDIDYDEKFEEINDKLSDFKQELQLISTDITESFNTKLSDLLNKIISIKTDAQNIEINDNTDEINNNVNAIFKDVQESELSEQNSILIEGLCEKISQRLQKSQNDLKDFVLNDTDSVIIKLDSLREYIENAISGYVSPEAGQMPEIIKYKDDLNNFRESFEKSLKDTADSIMSYIALQNEDLRSLLVVAKNHDEILEAIESLKSYVKKLKNSSDADEDEENEELSGLTSVEYDDLYSVYTKLSKKIIELSDQNSSIVSALDLISMKLEESYAGSTLNDYFDNEDLEITDKDSGFDFIKAFEILQNDISSLKDQVKNLNKISKDSDVDPEEMTNSEEILNSVNESWLNDFKNYIKASNKEFSSKIDAINSKLDIIVSDTSSSDILEDISDTVYNVDEKISSMLQELNKCIAQIPSGNSTEEELTGIKNLIQKQQNYIDKLQPNEKLDAFKRCLDELTEKVNNLASETGTGNENLHKSVKDVKDSIMNAVLTIFDQVSFVEESEDIKDFVEERTDEINKNIEQITKQLQQISSGVPNDYNYSLQDVETDLAKLRLALNELKVDQNDTHNDDMAQITEKLHSITSLVDSLTQDEMQEIKSEITNLKEQTQFLIATSDKSYNALNSGIVGFEEIINDSLTGKVDKVTKMLEKSADADNVIKQALIYMGEWIDSASENINKISVNSENIAQINDNLNMLKSSINTEVTQSIENKFDLWNSNLQKLERQFTTVENLEEQISRQQDRIDRMEMNIDKLISMVENMDDSTSLRKIEKIEKQLSKLGTSIEKLTSYVE